MSMEVLNSTEQLPAGLNELYLKSMDNRESEKTMDAAYRFFTSPIVYTLVGMSLAFPFMPMAVWAVSVTGVFTGFAMFPKKVPKSLLYELSLVHNFMNDSFTKWNFTKGAYFNHMQDGIYLGALPLKSHKHQEKLLREFKIKAILSITEEFELTTKTFFTSPITPTDWQNLGVIQLHISVEDMTPIELKDLHLAANFIQQYKDGLYIHCKAGRGRSVISYMAYLIKYESMSFEDAFAFAKDKRPLTSINPSQFTTLREFENDIKKNSSRDI